MLWRYIIHEFGFSLGYGSYDFVVVGAGAAGAVVANRLSEIKDWSVLVLEAGGYGNDFTKIPDMYWPSEFTRFNWGYNSTPQRTACLGRLENALMQMKFNFKYVSNI